MDKNENKKRLEKELKRKGFKILKELKFNEAERIFEGIIADEENREFALQIFGDLGLEDIKLTLLKSNNPGDKIGDIASAKLANIPNIQEPEEDIPEIQPQMQGSAMPDLKINLPEKEEEMPDGFEFTDKFKKKDLSHMQESLEGAKMRGGGTQPAQPTQSTSAKPASRSRQTSSGEEQTPGQSAGQNQQQDQQQRNIREEKQERMRRQQLAQQAGHAGAHPGAPAPKSSPGSKIAKRALKIALGTGALTITGASWISIISS